MLFPLEKVRKGFSDLIFSTLGRIVLARTCSHAPVVAATTAGIFGDEASKPLTKERCTCITPRRHYESDHQRTPP